jgi:hypothetical protein
MRVGLGQSRRDDRTRRSCANDDPIHALRLARWATIGSPGLVITHEAWRDQPLFLR